MEFGEGARRSILEDMDALHTTEADRQELHALVDRVCQSILTVPLDDEPETEQERAEVEAARSEKGPGTAHEEVLRQFGV